MARTANGVTTVLIVDDHAMFREALRKLLENEPGFWVAGEASDGREAIRMAGDLRPDVLLLDLRMATPGLEALRQISRTTPSVRTLILTAEVGDSDVVEALRLGAKGVLTKHSAPELLFESIRSIMAGEYWVGRECVADLIHQVREKSPTPTFTSRGPTLGLTRREMQMVSAVIAGCSNGDIAQKFAISAKTVKHHLTNVFDKLGVSNRLELALFAVQRRFDAERFFES